MKKIFITGSSGCIGHYLVENLIQNTDHELFLLVRNPDKLQFDPQARTGIHLLQGDLEGIEQFFPLISTMDVVILAATSWGGITEAYEINVVKMLQLMQQLDPSVCEQVIYFSTASILDRHSQPLPEAGDIGTNYIRTKYACYTRLGELPIAEKITTVFPTLVFGGDENKPYSHLSGGLEEVIRWVDLIRWLKAEGSFHFIHAYDIAQVVAYLVDHPPSSSASRDLVLGHDPHTVNITVEEICQYLDKKIYFRIPLSLGLANFFIALFRLKMAEWDRFCLDYRHFTYKDPVNPATFGLKPYCATITDILKVTLVDDKSNVL